MMADFRFRTSDLVGSLVDMFNPQSAIRNPQWDGPLAQLVEQLTLNQRVAGSSPARPTILTRAMKNGKLTTDNGMLITA